MLAVLYTCICCLFLGNSLTRSRFRAFGVICFSLRGVSLTFAVCARVFAIGVGGRAESRYCRIVVAAATAAAASLAAYQS